MCWWRMSLTPSSPRRQMPDPFVTVIRWNLVLSNEVRRVARETSFWADILQRLSMRIHWIAEILFFRVDQVTSWTFSSDLLDIPLCSDRTSRAYAHIILEKFDLRSCLFFGIEGESSAKMFYATPWRTFVLRLDFYSLNLRLLVRRS